MPDGIAHSTPEWSHRGSHLITCACNGCEVQLPHQLGRESRTGPNRGVPAEHTPFHPAERQRAAAGREPFLRETKRAAPTAIEAAQVVRGGRVRLKLCRTTVTTAVQLLPRSGAEIFFFLSTLSYYQRDLEAPHRVTK